MGGKPGADPRLPIPFKSDPIKILSERVKWCIARYNFNSLGCDRCADRDALSLQPLRRERIVLWCPFAVDDRSAFPRRTVANHRSHGKLIEAKHVLPFGCIAECSNRIS